MGEPIENEYFNWLCAKVLPVDARIYYSLARILHSTEFVWLVPGDRNRKEDGEELRIDFLRETQRESDPAWFNQPCSIFEMLIALSGRASFQTAIPVRDWFKTFLANLGLDGFTQVTHEDAPVIDDILYTLVWRTYDSTGHGGLFPMRQPQNDQREVEIWYQFFEYVDEQGLI
jgi:hypothetical protein